MSRFMLCLLPALLLPGMQAGAAEGKSCDRPRLQAATPVRSADQGEVVIATQNLWRLFDDVDDGVQVLTPEVYQRKLSKLSRQVVDVLQLPDVVAVQEVENAQVLASLAAAIARRSGQPPYRVALVEGQDPGGIDVGYLIRSDWKVVSLTPLLAAPRLDGKPLFDRPPLHLVVQLPAGERLELVNVHLKSLKGSEHPGKAGRIAVKRRRQASALAGWWQQYVRQHPGAPLVMLGDFNATPEVIGGVDVMGMLQAAGLRPALLQMPEDERYSYVFRCRPELIDNILVAPALQPRVTATAASRGNADASRRMVKRAETAVGSSDHDALVLYLRTH